MNSDERDKMAEYVSGYREGDTAGFREGVQLGRSQGYDNAKWRAFAAVAGRSKRAKRSIEHYLGSLDGKDV